MSILRQLRSLFRKESLDAEMSAEMQSHVDLQTEHNLKAGMNSDEARYAALRQFGNVASLQEQAREGRRWLWLEQGLQDLRYAVRQVRRDPGFAAVAMLTLAIGTGANTAIFSLVHSLILKPLHYEESGQLVQVWEAPGPGSRNVVSPGLFRDWQAQATTFESLGAMRSLNLNLTGAGEPVRITGLRTTSGWLHTMRARPMLGRIFASDEDQPGKERVIVLTAELWQRSFGSDREIVGRKVELDGQPYTVIGVLPPGFLPSLQDEFVVPYVFEPSWREMRYGHFLQVVGRLRPGATTGQAQAELAAIVERAKPHMPAWKKDWSVTVLPLRDQFATEVRTPLLVLLAAVGFVLLVACANVANLLLAKASARQREIAVRAALGASRGRIIRQLLAESLVLSFGGAALGLLFAFWSMAGLRQLAETMNVPRAHEIALDGNVLGVTLLVAMATGVVFGLGPALSASRFSLTETLKDATRASAGGGTRLRQGLIVGEVALALVLLAGAGLLLRSFHRLVNVAPGFAPEQALTMQLSVPEKHYPHNANRADFFARIVERIEAIPGVDSAGIASAVPLASSYSDNFFKVDGRADQPEPGYAADYDACTPHLFRALGIPLRRGRTFAAADTQTRVVIVNEEFVRRYFPGEDPVGRRLVYNGKPYEIVGIAGDVRSRNLAAGIRPLVYWPQSPFEATRNAHLVVRGKLPSMVPTESIRQAILAIDPRQPVARVRTLGEVIGASLAQQRVLLLLLGGFAGVGLLMTAIGLYGVIAYAVVQRTREMGIRLALGGTRRNVLGLIMGQVIRLVLLGLVIGLGAALGLARLMKELLYETAPADPLAFAAVSVVLLVTAVIASWLPARRAAKVDPMVALRAE